MSDFATMCWPSMKSVVPPAVAWRKVPPRLIWLEANAASVSGPNDPPTTMPSAAARRRMSCRVMPRSISRLSASSAVVIRASSGLPMTPHRVVGHSSIVASRKQDGSFAVKLRRGGLERHRRPRTRTARPVRARTDDRGGEGAPRPRRDRQVELEREPLRAAAGSARRDPRGAREHLAVPGAAVHRLPQRGGSRLRHERGERGAGARQPRAARPRREPAPAPGRPRRRAGADVRPLRADLGDARGDRGAGADAGARDRPRGAGRSGARRRCPHRVGLRPQQPDGRCARPGRVEGLPRRAARPLRGRRRRGVRGLRRAGPPNAS